ncbi:MAG TPA: hypothetical protein VMF58_16520 [Rhizomicrobium sp.]|nr:hypothetical protein [Rhizomicrobium sp.]
MKLSACAMLALLTATPGLADPPDDATRNMQMQNNYTVVDPVETQPDTQHLGPCAQILERAYYMADPANLGRALDARREMELARTAYQAGDEFACERHAAHALDDRS